MLTKPLLGAVAAMGAALLWFYIQNLQLEMDLQAAVIKQKAAEISLATAQQTAKLVDLQLAASQEKLAQIEVERNNARVQVDKMRDIFQDHDFAKLITKKPGLIENRMIKKTEEVFNEIEVITSSE